MAFYASSTATHRPAAQARRRAETRAPVIPTTVGGTILIAGLIAGLCFLYLWQHAAILDLTAQREGARAELVDLQELNRFLQFQIDQAFSLARISRLARNSLGMIEPKIIHYVPFHDDGP